MKSKKGTNFVPFLLLCLFERIYSPKEIPMPLPADTRALSG